MDVGMLQMCQNDERVPYDDVAGQQKVKWRCFVFFWGLVFLVTTTLVFIFKHEIDHSIPQRQEKAEDGHHHPMDEEHGDELSLNVFETYTVLVKILCLKPMLIMVVVLLTGKIAFAATDGMTDLKLINAGLTTDKIASRSIFLTPLQIILPWVLGKQTAGPKPLNVFLWAYPYRLVMSLALALFVYWTPSFREANGEYPYFYYAIWIGTYYLQQVSSYCIFLSMMAFNAQISDPKIGGTYMTLLNTLNNLGGNWPVTLFLSITDFFNRKNCVAKSSKIVLGVCTRKHEEELCKAGGDVCEFVVDGYYISVAICVVVGLLWYRIFYRRIKYFQKIPRQEWRRFLIKSVASRSFNAVRTMRVVPIPALHDNYMYLIVDDQQPKGERLAAIVDPVDVAKIFKTVKEEGALLQAALVTHHHSDHAGGTAELAKVAAASSSACAGLVKAPLCIYSGDAARVHCTDKVLGDGQTAELGPLLHIQAMHTPCHTSTHVCYYVVDQRTNERAVFTGDTLFVGGCGRFFEGTAEQMHCALNERLAALPDETMVFCGHEYTVANLQFALTMEPSNGAIRRKLDWAMAQRAANKWTVPSSIGEEKRHNVFMRVDNSAEVQRNCGTGPEDPVGTMAKLRERKNSFKG
uniref:hydroxyacylglutathione hydrolase n=1 Tax=Globodera rostochiensis TaxID=31243 RepID=A0A914HHW4_GLORO